MSAAEQLEMELPDIYRHRLLMERKIHAARKLCGERSVKVVAAALDEIWGPLGHTVSASTLSNALRDHERNYWRSEWDSWFCDECEEFAEVVAEMIGKGKAKKSPEEQIEDYERLVRDALSPKNAEALIRKARGL
jgi:hypothetical protein